MKQTCGTPGPDPDIDPEIVLDISRLMSRVMYRTPTGVDRVEMAYARGLLARIPARLSFGAFRPAGIYCRLENRAVSDFLALTEDMWEGGWTPKGRLRSLAAIRRLVAMRPKRIPPRSVERRRVYLQVSPHHLDRPALVERILRREGARFICLVHDLIPIEFPEYARPGGAGLHRVRMDTLGRYADWLIANSEATATALRTYLEPSGRVPPISVSHLGTDRKGEPVMARPIDIPYFVCVSTIEPRKNHLLLLQLWRNMARVAKPGEVIPKLVIIGRRGWECENVIDLLDRSPHLKDHVIEQADMADPHVRDIVRGSRALLLPSFAEGYGMPVAEALEMGVPVICSDLAALREVGGDVPEYLDPLDGPAWQRAIADYAADGSSRRAAQLSRMTAWRPTTWDDHLDAVLAACAEVSR